MTVAVPIPSCSIPAADHAALAGLSDDAVRAWVLTRAQEYRNIALALLSIFNAVAPIHRAFPTEVLSEIFSHCWMDPQSIAVAHVCRHWRSIALKTPSLWTAALAAPGKLLSQHQSCRYSRREFSAFALARSSPQPLRLKVYHFPDHFASTLAPHAARLVDLYVRLDGASSLSTLCKFLNSGAPNLEVLGVTFPGYVGMYEDWLPLREDAHDDDFGPTPTARTKIHEELAEDLWEWSESVRGPVLDTVALPRLHTIRCIPIDLFPYFTTPTLRDVCVTPAQFTDDHLNSFAKALTRCPALERLKFWIVGKDFTTYESEQLDGDPVESHLPDFNSHTWSRVDSVTTVPALQTVVINADIYPASRLYLRSLLCPLPIIIEVIAKNTTLPRLVRRNVKLTERIQNANMARICDCEPGNNWKIIEVATFKDDVALARLELATFRWDAGPVKLDCASVFDKHGANITRLVVHQNEDGIYSELVEILHAFPNLTSLDVAGESVSRALWALSGPESEEESEDGDYPFISQHLRTLVVAFPRKRGSVQKMIEASPAEWEEKIAMGVRDDFATLVKTLRDRASSGLRLERLEWRVVEWDDALRLEFPPTAVVRTYVPPPALFRQMELETLVDGLVVFGGVTYQVSPQELRAYDDPSHARQRLEEWGDSDSDVALS